MAVNRSILSTQEGPYLSLLIEPVNKIRFRYISEKGSHGVLIGKSGKKTFPTVKLENYHGKKAVEVKASLYTPDQTSLHVLELMGKNCKEGVCVQTLDSSNTAQFNTLSVLNKKREEVVQTLVNRKLSNHRVTGSERKKLEEKYKKEVSVESKDMNLNSACICFEAYYADGSNSRKPICEKIFTERIDNLKSTQLGDLRICRISKSSGSCAGGEDMILLCEKVKKEDIKVRFYEVDEADNIIWEEYGDFSKADVHYQVAISFKTPEYKENVGKVVFIQLLRMSNGDTSAGVKFEYIPNENDISAVSRKRKKCNPPQERNDLLTSSEHVFPALNGNNTTCFSAGNHGTFSMNSPENSLSSLSADEMLNHILNGGLEDSSSNSFTSPEVPNHDVPSLFSEDLIVHPGDPNLMPLQIDPLYDLAAILPSWMSSNDDNFEIQSDSQVVVMDGISSQLQDLKLNAPDSSLRPNNNTKDIHGKEEKKCLKSTFIKDLNVLQNYISALIVDQAGKSTDDNQQHQKLKVIQKLLELSPSVVNKQNKLKETLLHVSTQLNCPHILEILLKYCGNPNLRNNNGDNCLHIAARNNYVKCMEVLCSSLSRNFRLDLNALNYEGLAPLHVALENESEECMALLLHYGANINVEEAKSGRTILHLAVDSCPSMVPFILKQPGISVNAMDFGGNTPLDIANHNELCDVERQLLRAGAVEEYEGLNQDKEDSLTENGPLIVTDEHSEILLPLGNVSETSTENYTFHEEEIYNINDDRQFLSPSVGKKICELIDPPDDRWRILGFTMGLDETCLNAIEKNFEFQSSPTRALLDCFQMKFGNNSRTAFLQELQSKLEVVGIKDDVLIS